MAIVVNLDVMMAKRKMNLTELSKKVNVGMVNLSYLKTGKARGIKISTLNALCKVLECKPSDIIDYVDDETFRKLFPKG